MAGHAANLADPASNGSKRVRKVLGADEDQRQDGD